MAAARRSFEQVWPDVADQLHALFASKGMALGRREDLVQETGLRLFKMWSRVDPDRPVWPLAVTIALNLVRDEARRRPEREILGDIPDAPGNLDVERSGLARIECARVARAMKKLSPAHRSILMMEIGQNADRDPAGAATKMMRLRARRKLTAMLESASASALALVSRSRALLEGAVNAVMGRGVGGETATSAALAVVIAALTFGAPLLGNGPAPGNSRSGAGPNIAAPPSAPLSAVAGDIAEPAQISAASASGSAAGLNGNSNSTKVPGRGPAPAPPTNDDVVVALPTEGGWVAARATVSVGGYGVELGRQGNGAPPVCVLGLSAYSLGCAHQEPDTKAKAKARVTAAGQDVTVERGAETGL